MHRVLPFQAIALAVGLLVGCSESGTRIPTAPEPQPALAAALAGAADNVQVKLTIGIRTGQTVHFTIAITGGDPNVDPVWTCASADTTVALAGHTNYGCSATGVGVGTTDITRDRHARHGDRHRLRRPSSDPSTASRRHRARRRHGSDGPDRPVHPRNHRRGTPTPNRHGHARPPTLWWRRP